MNKRISDYNSLSRFSTFSIVSRKEFLTCKYLEKENALVEFLEIKDKNQRKPFYRELFYAPIKKTIFSDNVKFNAIRLREETYYVEGHGIKSIIAGTADTNTSNFGTRQYYKNYGTSSGITISFFGRPKSSIVDFILCEGNVKNGDMYVNFTEKPNFQDRIRAYNDKTNESVIIQIVIDKESFKKILESYRKQFLRTMTFHITFEEMPEVYKPTNFDKNFNKHLKILSGTEEVGNSEKLPLDFKFSNDKFYKLKNTNFNDTHIVLSSHDQSMSGKFFHGIGFTDKINKNLD